VCCGWTEEEEMGGEERTAGNAQSAFLSADESPRGSSPSMWCFRPSTSFDVLRTTSTTRPSHARTSLIASVY
jgi:hypothetical protein